MSFLDEQIELLHYQLSQIDELRKQLHHALLLLQFHQFLQRQIQYLWLSKQLVQIFLVLRQF